MKLSIVIPTKSFPSKFIHSLNKNLKSYCCEVIFVIPTKNAKLEQIIRKHVEAKNLRILKTDLKGPSPRGFYSQKRTREVFNLKNTN